MCRCSTAADRRSNERNCGPAAARNGWFVLSMPAPPTINVVGSRGTVLVEELQVDSCFLCVIGGGALPPYASRHASEGFGTCRSCSVHACQIHGDKLRGQSFFHCVDCLSKMGLVTAITTSPPSTQSGVLPSVDPEVHSLINEAGASGFRGVAPGIATVAYRPASDVNLDVMNAALRRLVNAREEPDLAGYYAEASYDRTRWDGTAWALGLLGPVPDHYRRQWLGLSDRAARRIVTDVLHVAVCTAQLELRQLELVDGDSPEILDWCNRVATWSLAAAYGARGTDQMSVSPYDLRGGLRMAPVVLLLGIFYSELML